MRKEASGRWLVALALSLSVLAAGPPGASAQYFGGNKVQYKTLEFEVLRTTHFDVYFYPEEREAARQAGRMAERWHARLSTILQHQLSTRQPLVLYASHADFQQTNIIGGEIGEGTGGVTESFKRRIALPLAATMADTDHVLGHELVHAFQYDIADRARRGQSAGSGLAQLPLWFIEGMAEYLSIGPVDPHTAMWIRDAARIEKLPTVRQLGSARYFPYRWGQAFWAYVAGRWGDQVVAELLDAGVRTGSAEAAIRRVLSVEPNDLSHDWHAAIHAAYVPLAAEKRSPLDYGTLVTPESGRPGDLNVSPSLSPDGRLIAYFSGRSLVSVDLMLADVETGTVTRSIVRTALDPHFSSLQYINSAGSWRADGRAFVFGAVSQGRPGLVLYDIARGRIDREIPFPMLGEILSPSWSPDGRFIAFSATSGGATDLFIYDLQDESLRRMTNDPFADIQPAWSPDGQSVAFVTERFGSNLSVLQPGTLRLALLDVGSGAIRPIDTFMTGKSINPAWSSDGTQLYFLSDEHGVTNLYAVSLADDCVRAVTDLYEGISGITSLSPAISSASAAPRLAFSAYRNGGYHIYIADSDAVLREARFGLEPLRISPAVLPPQEREPGVLMALLADPTVGLPEGEGQVGRYRPRLSLDYVGQPYITAGVDPLGTFVGGGVSFLWSDMLGDHNLATAVQMDTSFGTGSDVLKNTAGIVAYSNLKRRWNWGAAVQQVPYLSGGISSGIGTADGTRVQVDETVIVRQTNRAVSGITTYPFSRAQRVEFSAGYQQLSFEQQVKTRIWSLSTGQLLSDGTSTTSLADTLKLGTTTTALVFDNSIFGATSPVAGQRYRLEATPTMGTISFTGALADYRRYVAPVPFYTIAGRVLHYGRYGNGAEDYRLPPLFIGYPQLVRGYDIGSFDASECRADATSTCPVFDRLLGSRMMVANLELRFPLLRPFGVQQGMYGPVPIEVALFSDAGLAWTSQRTPSFAGGNRTPVTSTGVTFRVNLFGFAVAQLDFARPLQRPDKGWVFAFSLGQGF